MSKLTDCLDKSNVLLTELLKQVKFSNKVIMTVNIVNIITLVAIILFLNKN